MLELYSILDNLISPICTCYADHYPEDLEAQDGAKIYPYVAFSIENTNPTESLQGDLNSLIIDIWNDKASDINEIEAITDNINKVIDKYSLIDDSMYLTIYKNNPYRLRIPDPEPHIQRRQLRYIVKVYCKN